MLWNVWLEQSGERKEVSTSGWMDFWGSSQTPVCRGKEQWNLSCMDISFLFLWIIGHCFFLGIECPVSFVPIPSVVFFTVCIAVVVLCVIECCCCCCALGHEPCKMVYSQKDCLKKKKKVEGKKTLNWKTLNWKTLTPSPCRGCTVKGFCTKREPVYPL